METDHTKRCPCGVQYKKGINKGKWSPDHIHPNPDGTFYCGECGKTYPMEVAIKIEKEV